MVKLPFRYGKYEGISFVNKDGSLACSNEILKENTAVKISICMSGKTDKFICWNVFKISLE